jgi:4-hydroxybenzoate polyprenyltransferase
MEGTSSSGQDVEKAVTADIGSFLKLVRPKQWTKNLIVFAPVFFAKKLHVQDLFVAVLLCFVAFCLVSSSIYILNDVFDRANDRAHPTKKRRPIASGAIGVPLALIMAGVFAASSLGLSYYVRPELAIVVLCYLLLMIFYSTVLKHLVLLDVFSIAAGFVLRAVGGAVAASVPVSGWFLLCTSFGALYLALEKRRQELNLLKSEAEVHRRTLTIYNEEMLNRIESVVVPSLITCYSFYSFQSQHGHGMLLTVPFVLYGIMRYQVLSVRYFTTGTPEEVLLKDRPIQVTILLWALTSALVMYDVIQVTLIN